MTVSAKQSRCDRRHAGKTAVSATYRSSGILTLLLYAFSSFTLPVRLEPEVFLSRRAPATPGAMTTGCAEASCCTSRCYLDEEGAHHCVPADGRSCDCGLSSGKTPAGAILMEDMAIIPALGRPVPESPAALLAREFPPAPESSDLSPVTPPPRS